MSEQPMVVSGFFARRADGFHAQGYGISQWSAEQVNGPAVCGLLARELETHCPAEGFTPARLTVDLFRPVLTEPITVRSELVRVGRRVLVADAAIVQRDEVRARASASFLAVADPPSGELWQPTESLPVPAERYDAPEGSYPLLKVGDGDWTHDLSAARSPERKTLWQNLIPVVEGEPITPFQRAAAVGDSTNFICHWTAEGNSYINTDLTLTLARLPLGPELGLRARDQVTAHGVAVGTATLYDRTGPLGTCVVTSVANAHNVVHTPGTAR
ncbi:thioesterase family protein [Nocardia takedensis]|uniref:thioesterase family protein n=1 Tax=Nocardia takedensis TaxID=259390 RepID=UPI001FE10D40|nr:thioesterase family protein [Nocardia takedensis]